MSENCITISTLGNCVTRDIFRVSDKSNKFQLIGNVGFISPISINAEPYEKIEEISSIIQQCKDYGFNKRSRLLDISKNVWDYLNENRGEYLLLELSDIRFPVLKKQQKIITYREYQAESEVIAKRNLLNDGYRIMQLQDFSMEEILNSVDQLCKQVLKLWTPDKILLLFTVPVNTLLTEKGIDKKNQHIHRMYESKTYWWMLKKVNERALSILNCEVINMPKLQFVASYKKHMWGPHPFHYTDAVYQYLYDDICEKLSIIKTGKKRETEMELERQYYQQLRAKKIPEKFLNDECLECLATDKISEYLKAIRKLKNCLVIVALKDTAGGYFTNEIQELFQMLGLTKKLVKQYMVGYIALIRDNVVIEEKKSKKGEFLNEVYHIDFLDLNIVSKPYNNGNVAEIVINGVDYAVNERGLNIVIYDYKTQKVFDSVAFDTHNKAIPCSRQNDFIDGENMIRVDIKKLKKSLLDK